MSGNESFGNASFWREYVTTPDHAERLVLMRSLIPTGTRNVLDIGYGKGDWINTLLDNNTAEWAIGVDPFLAALRLLKAPAVQGMLPRIPFREKSFDLVVCLQVLEQLAAEDFFPSVVELQRLAKKHIIIGVSYKENLQTLQVRCSACGRLSHTYGQVRSFAKEDMFNFLPEFIAEKLILAGVMQRRRSAFGVFVEHRFADLYHTPTDYVCPYCYNNLPATCDRPAVICIGAQLLDRVLTRLSRLLHYWQIVLYRRKEAEISNE